MQTIALANHKGGVGKTTTTLNLACTLAEAGQRVLVVDLDPQANTTEGFGLEAHTPRLEAILVDGETHDLTTDAVHYGSALRDRIETLPPEPLLAAADRMWVLPTSFGLVGAMDPLVAQGPAYPFRLRDLLRANRDVFDIVLIDTPAVGATMWTNLGLLAADWVIAPASPADYDVRAAAKQAQFLTRYLGSANPGLRMLGVLITMADRRWRLVGASERAMDNGGLPRIPSVIPLDNRGNGIKTALRTRRPFYFTEPDGRVVQAYREVAGHVLATMNGGTA